jgi:electron transport complex protein RnfC
MTGTAIVDALRTVITAATQAVLLMTHKPALRTTGCIRCGWCIHGCPAGIDPIAILDAFEAGQMRTLAHLATQRCIDCGVCSAICPSHLPLAQAARTARALLSRAGT